MLPGFGGDEIRRGGDENRRSGAAGRRNSANSRGPLWARRLLGRLGMSAEKLTFSGVEALADVELLSVVVGGGLRPASALLDRFGGLRGLERAGLQATGDTTGVGMKGACRVAAALALGRRLLTPLRPGLVIRAPVDVWRAVAPRLGAQRTEQFYALALDCRGRIQREIFIAAGTVAGVDVDPREAFRVLVQESAFATIFVHNHPSGDPTPSAEDERLTRRLCDAGRLLGIRVLDHVVVARQGFVSLLSKRSRAPPPEKVDTSDATPTLLADRCDYNAGDAGPASRGRDRLHAGARARRERARR
jgi:DNA repair protein RadC